jgi:methylthioribose-1-phosphate isomerase
MWELKQYGVPSTLICDSMAAQIMREGKVQAVIVGADRITARGDTANKIGTYLKALAAKDNNIPFYAALPSSSIDWTIEDGLKEIEIEKKNAETEESGIVEQQPKRKHSLKNQKEG